MKKQLPQILFWTAVVAVIIGYGIAVDYAYYQRDLHKCMQEGSRQDCQKKLQ